MKNIKIDTVVAIISDKNGGKSNQIRSVFEEQELYSYYNGYPRQKSIRKIYDILPDIRLYLRLSSPHEMNENYDKIKNDIYKNAPKNNHRYKVIIPMQVTAAPKIAAGEEVFRELFSDFDIRRGCAIWLNPDVSNRTPFTISRQMAEFMSTRRHVSVLAIDSYSVHPSVDPKKNSINSRIIADILFRI